MSQAEAVGKILELTAALIEHVKDRKTAAIIQQIQALQQTIIADDAHLRSENSNLKAENLQLKQQLTQPQQGDRCPYCHRHTAQLQRLEKDEDMDIHGIKQGFYKCSSCGKEFDKKVGPGF